MKARIVTAAEGNPLFVEQMLSMLVDSEALRLEDGRYVATEALAELAVPPTINALSPLASTGSPPRNGPWSSPPP